MYTCGLKPRHSSVSQHGGQTDGGWGFFFGREGKGEIGSSLLLMFLFFSIRELFWRLGVGYASYGQLPRFDSKQNEKKRRCEEATTLEEQLCDDVLCIIHVRN